MVCSTSSYGKISLTPIIIFYIMMCLSSLAIYLSMTHIHDNYCKEGKIRYKIMQVEKQRNGPKRVKQGRMSIPTDITVY